MAALALTATAGPVTVTVDDLRIERSASQLIVRFTLDASTLRLSSDSEIRYRPVVACATDTAALPPIVVAGRNRYIQNRRHEAIAPDATLSRTGRTIDYMAVVPFEPWMEQAKLSLVEDACECGFRSETATTEDIAQLHFAKPVFAPRFTFVTPPAELRKERAHHGQAYIDFPVSKATIYPDYRRNPEELAKIRATIDAVQRDPDSKITGVSITGYASPESPYANNERLARLRAQALAEHVRSLYSFGQGVMHADWVAENWQGLRAYIDSSALPERSQLLALIDDASLTPDAREARIKTRFPDTYRFLLHNVYPGLRRSDYKVDYVVRAFTSVDEIRRIMATAPQKLDLHEIYAVANTLEPGSDAYREAFELAARLFPDNADANLNMTAIALQRGELQRAEAYLAKAGHSPRAVYARGVLAYRQGKAAEAVKLIGEAAEQGLPEAADALKQIERLKSAAEGFTRLTK